MTDYDTPTKRTSVLVRFEDVYSTEALYDTLAEVAGSGGFHDFIPLVTNDVAVAASESIAHAGYLSRVHASAAQMVMLLQNIVVLTERGELVAATEDVHQIATLLAVAAEVVEYIGTPEDGMVEAEPTP